MKVAPKSFIKFVQETVKTPRVDDLGFKVYDNVGYLEFPDGKRVGNMLDAAIAATGMQVEGYTPDKVVDFLA